MSHDGAPLASPEVTSLEGVLDDDTRIAKRKTALAVLLLGPAILFLFDPGNWLVSATLIGGALAVVAVLRFLVWAPLAELRRDLAGGRKHRVSGKLKQVYRTADRFAGPVASARVGEVTLLDRGGHLREVSQGDEVTVYYLPRTKIIVSVAAG